MTGPSTTADQTATPPERAPRISVVIPAFNAESFLGRALDSVRAQTLPAHEVLVVDDGSTDRTASIADAHDVQARCLRVAHGGQAAATNIGIRAASGDMIALLDADDEWLPRRLERTVSALIDDPAAGLSFCHAIVRHPDGREELRGPRRRYRRPGGIYPPDHACVPGMTFRRWCFDELGYFDESMPTYNDHDMFLRVSERFRVVEISEQLVRVHFRPDSQQQGYSVETNVEMYLRVVLKALGRGATPGSRERALGAVYFHTGLTLGSAGRTGKALRHLAISGVLSPRGDVPLAMLGVLVPQRLVRWAGNVRRRLRRPGRKGRNA